MILTDWEDINKLHDRDKIVSSKKEAIRLAINAGIDMSMVPYEYEEFIDNLMELVNEGKVTMDRIDEAVSKITLGKPSEIDGRKCKSMVFNNFDNSS